MADASKFEDPRNPLNHLNSKVGMHLAFWAYPQSDIKKANEIAPYPQHWKPAKPGEELPRDWPVAKQDINGRLEKGSPEGWNTQHSKEGKLENQFMISINDKTREITFDFKGSDAWSNWKSDFGNAGASEFAKIQEKAQKAFDEISKNPDYKEYRFAATGHSLGGGMAQSFALRNDMDVYVYNSLPIARDTINSDYFKEAGGFDAAIARYKSTGHRVHDVRTPNDIATYNYEGVMQNRYLSHHVEPGRTMLPGTSLSVPIKTVLMLSGYGTLPATAIMGKDHTMSSMLNTQHGLSVNELGVYRIPEGHQDFAQLPPQARKLFSKLSESPVIATTLIDARGVNSPEDKYVVTHEDGSKEHILVNGNSGAIEIDRYNKDGKRTFIEMNPLRKQPATVIEYDNNGKPLKTEIIALHNNTTTLTETADCAAKSPEDIIRSRIAENLANDPDFLLKLASLGSRQHAASLAVPRPHTHPQELSQVKPAEL